MSTAKNSSDPSSAATETLLSHLIELRDRILRMFLAILVVFLILFPFANPIYTWIATPLMVHLPEGTSMIAIEVAAPFLIPFKLVLLLAVVLTIPYTLYQVWAFVAPGLYKHEQQMAMPLVVSSTILFYLGMAFAYFVVFPLIFAFFTATAPEGVAVMTDISRYLDFIIMLFLAFGIAFEVPIATILLVKMGVTTPDKLARKRPYVIVGTFVVGMVLTPPDIISQTLLALPMWLLFEIGLLLSRIMEKRKAEQAAAEGADDDTDDLDPDPKPGSPVPPAGPKPRSGDNTSAPSASTSPVARQWRTAAPSSETPLPAAAAVGATSTGTATAAGSTASSEHATATNGSVAAPAETTAAAEPGNASNASAQSNPAPAGPESSNSPESPNSAEPNATSGGFRPLTPEEMDAELDRLEQEHAPKAKPPSNPAQSDQL